MIFGGVNIKQQKEQLKEKPPSVIVATPGRCKALAKEGDISLKQCGHFILKHAELSTWRGVCSPPPTQRWALGMGKSSCAP